MRSGTTGKKAGPAALIVLVCAAAASAGGDPPPACPALSFEQLAAMPWAELEQLYRQAAPGAIPNGFARGRVVYPPCERHGGLKTTFAGLTWHGKHFCAADGTLVNQWLGVRAIRARVGYGESWLDGRPAIILDYSCTSHVWADVRDETREVAPGLYVGAMYRHRCSEPYLKLFFVLQAEPGCCPAGPPSP
jgi:hypothetical protein